LRWLIAAPMNCWSASVAVAAPLSAALALPSTRSNDA
jgi:hypothetical protein